MMSDNELEQETRKGWNMNRERDLLSTISELKKCGESINSQLYSDDDTDENESDNDKDVNIQDQDTSNLSTRLRELKISDKSVNKILFIHEDSDKNCDEISEPEDDNTEKSEVKLNSKGPAAGNPVRNHIYQSSNSHNYYPTVNESCGGKRSFNDFENSEAYKYSKPEQTCQPIENGLPVFDEEGVLEALDDILSVEPMYPPEKTNLRTSPHHTNGINSIFYDNPEPQICYPIPKCGINTPGNILVEPGNSISESIQPENQLGNRVDNPIMSNFITFPHPTISAIEKPPRSASANDGMTHQSHHFSVKDPIRPQSLPPTITLNQPFERNDTNDDKFSDAQNLILEDLSNGKNDQTKTQPVPKLDVKSSNIKQKQEQTVLQDHPNETLKMPHNTQTQGQPTQSTPNSSGYLVPRTHTPDKRSQGQVLNSNPPLELIKALRSPMVTNQKNTSSASQKNLQEKVKAQPGFHNMPTIVHETANQDTSSYKTNGIQSANHPARYLPVAGQARNQIKGKNINDNKPETRELQSTNVQNTSTLPHPKGTQMIELQPCPVSHQNHCQCPVSCQNNCQTVNPPFINWTQVNVHQTKPYCMFPNPGIPPLFPQDSPGMPNKSAGELPINFHKNGVMPQQINVMLRRPEECFPMKGTIPTTDNPRQTIPQMGNLDFGPYSSYQMNIDTSMQQIYAVGSNCLNPVKIYQIPPKTTTRYRPILPKPLQANDH